MIKVITKIRYHFFNFVQNSLTLCLPVSEVGDKVQTALLQ